jgi:hypothetical protein
MPIRGLFRPALRQGHLGCGEVYDALHQHCDAEHAHEVGRNRRQVPQKPIRQIDPLRGMPHAPGACDTDRHHGDCQSQAEHGNCRSAEHKLAELEGEQQYGDRGRTEDPAARDDIAAVGRELARDLLGVPVEDRVS